MSPSFHFRPESCRFRWGWQHFHLLADPEALGEYCGVKPEEVFTISRKTMDRSDKARQDGAATLQRGVGFATLQRGAGGDLQSASSMTTLMRTSTANEYVNNAYIPPTFERMDMLHY